MSAPMTVGSLIEALRVIPASTWVCTEAGPVVGMKQELGANEPFVVLSVLEAAIEC